MFPYSKKCNHRWDVKCDKLIPSFIDRNKHLGGRVPFEMMQSTHIVIMVCIHCGKIDKTITKC